MRLKFCRPSHRGQAEIMNLTLKVKERSWDATLVVDTSQLRPVEVEMSVVASIPEITQLRGFTE
jgi:hypothetical protein